MDCRIIQGTISMVRVSKQLGGELQCGESPKECTHLWTPVQVQAVFEEDWRVVGCCHLSAMELRACMGVRGPAPNHKGVP